MPEDCPANTRRGQRSALSLPIMVRVPGCAAARRSLPEISCACLLWRTRPRGGISVRWQIFNTIPELLEFLIGSLFETFNFVFQRKRVSFQVSNWLRDAPGRLQHSSACALNGLRAMGCSPHGIQLGQCGCTADLFNKPPRKGACLSVIRSLASRAWGRVSSNHPRTPAAVRAWP